MLRNVLIGLGVAAMVIALLALSLYRQIQQVAMLAQIDARERLVATGTVYVKGDWQGNINQGAVLTYENGDAQFEAGVINGWYKDHSWQIDTKPGDVVIMDATETGLWAIVQHYDKDNHKDGKKEALQVVTLENKN